MSFFNTQLLSPNTISSYDTCINKWLPLVPLQSIDFIILFPKQSLTLLIKHLAQRQHIEQKQICTPTNIRHYIAPILAVLRHSPHIAPSIPDRVEYLYLWGKILDDCTKPIQERRMQQLPTVKQAEKGGSKLHYSELVAKRDSGSITMFQHLLLSMYTYIYPVRADYFSTQIIYENDVPTSKNWIRMYSDHAELMLTDFKTARYFKQIHYPSLPDLLFQIIKKSLSELPRNYLFVGKNNKPYTRVRFSQWSAENLEKIFDVELNITIIRHLYISTLSMDLPAQELKIIGDLMGHSFTQQKLYKWHSDAEKIEEKE